MPHKHTVLKGAALLTAAGLIGRIIGFFYRIFLSRVIGAEGLGIYQLIFPLYALSFSLTVSGIQTTISRFVSAKTASGDRGGARRIFHIGMALSLALSLCMSFLLLHFHGFLAENFVKEPRSSELLRLLAYAVPFGSLHACINGYYYGLKQAKIPAISEILEHLVRLGSVVLLCRIWTEKGIAITPAIAVYGIILEEFFAALFSATERVPAAIFFPKVREDAFLPEFFRAWAASARVMAESFFSTMFSPPAGTAFSAFADDFFITRSLAGCSVRGAFSAPPFSSRLSISGVIISSKIPLWFETSPFRREKRS